LKFFHIWFRSYWVALIEERFFPKRISPCLIACVVVNTGDKLISGFIVTGEKLSPVTLLLAFNYRRVVFNRRCPGIDENSGQGVSCVNDTGNN
jgi:hypothetical protein